MRPSPISIIQSITSWYCQSSRDLPWREAENARDPYRILVSEIMLQQTTVATVKVRYQQFLERFPTTKVLSQASIDEVLAQWQGLGYYNRARNLQAAAMEIEEKYKGAFPRDYAKVLSLPGVGKYTAGAVCSLAFEMPVPAIDVNVARVLSRVFVIEDDLKSTFVQRRFEELGKQLIQESAQNDIPPSQCNSALIELGALVCTKRIPLCSQCPVQKHCGAFAASVQHQLPRLPPRRAFVAQHDVCLYLTKMKNNHLKVLLRRCGETLNGEKKTKNWWRGMWELPRATVMKNQSAKHAASQLLHDEIGIEANVAECLKTMRHTVTHHKIRLDCFSVQPADQSHLYQIHNTAKSTFEWHDAANIETLALPSVMRKLLQSLLPTKMSVHESDRN